MKIWHLYRFMMMILLSLTFLLVACGGSGETEEVATAVPVADTAVPAPTETVVPTTAPAEAETSGETAPVEAAVNRATAMMAASGKPTPAPFAGLGGKDDEPVAAPAPTNTPVPTAVPSNNSVGIQVQNLSSTQVCFVYVTTPDSDNWGNDLLGENGVIELGANALFELPAGTYDIRMDDCFGKLIAVELGLQVNDVVSVAAQDAPLPEAGNAPITLINDLSDVNACYVYISLNPSDSWGDDWLGTGLVVPPDYQIALNTAPGTYDMQALDCGFNLISEQYGIEVGSSGYGWFLSGAAATASNLATLEIINNGSEPICYLQISLSTATEWGADWLGEDQMIDPNSSLLFELPADTYDARALNCNQEVIGEEYGVTIEGDLTWTLP